MSITVGKNRIDAIIVGISLILLFVCIIDNIAKQRYSLHRTYIYNPAPIKDVWDYCPGLLSIHPLAFGPKVYDTFRGKSPLTLITAGQLREPQCRRRTESNDLFVNMKQNYKVHVHVLFFTRPRCNFLKIQLHVCHILLD